MSMLYVNPIKIIKGEIDMAFSDSDIPNKRKT